MKDSRSEYSSQPSSNLEFSVSELKPFYHADLRKALAHIRFNKRSQKQGPLEKLFDGKTKTLKATVKALFDEIKLRENLDTHLLNKIDEDICTQHTHLIQLDQLTAHYSIDLFLETKKIRVKIEDKVLELEREKRTEYLECWRDLMFLKKYLLMALREYWDMAKRRELVSGSFEQL